jgi:xylan 1,4-beta-xylosidase
MQLMETLLGRLGSRLTLHFLPKQRELRLGTLGKFYDRSWHLRLGFRVGDELRLLPFAGHGAPTFPEIEMELTATALTFRAKDRNLGIAASFKFIAPFYPQAEKLCLAPFFYLDVKLDKLPAGQTVELVAQLELPDTAVVVPYTPTGHLADQSAGLKVGFEQIKSHWGLRTKPGSLSEQTFEAPIMLSLYDYPGETVKVSATSNSLSVGVVTDQPADFNLLLTSYIAEPVLEIKTVRHTFKYTHLFKDLSELTKYAIDEAANIKAKSARFDAIFAASSLGKTASDFLAFTFQNYITNTWWTLPATATAPDWENEWFSVWEGNCTFHSTVDVEYNLAWFYLLLWPDLLEKTISQWRGYLQDDERGVWLSHDIGGVLEANEQAYPHQMEVEENCNFVLLVYALWQMTGHETVRQDNTATVNRLLQFVINSDTTGNGWPNQGTANTIDDASAAVQYGREQTYLAVKALAAFWAGAQLIEIEDSTLAANYRERAKLVGKTLNEQAWLGDHYAVTLDRTTEGLVDPWTHEPLAPGELMGWDSYSLYTGNGLLYLLAMDTTRGADLPPMDWEKLKQDITNSLAHSLLEYGCTHSSSDRSNIWISQNLHRDMLAAYLGLDFSRMLDRYWAFEQFENGEFGRGGCFVDTYGHNRLHFYPRGITSLGLWYALGGIRHNRQQKRLLVRPAQVPLRLPLLGLADWEAERLSWISFYLKNGKVEFSIEEAELPEGWTIELD